MIRQENMSPEFTKYHLDFGDFKPVIHQFTGADKGGIHDHPFDFTSYIIKGWYIELVYNIQPDGYWFTEVFTRKEGDVIHFEAEHRHQIIRVSEGGCFTLIVPQKHKQKWGWWQFTTEIYHRYFDEPDFRKLTKEEILKHI